MNMKLLVMLAILSTGPLSMEGRAAAILTDGANQLVGATGVAINGAFYDVTFVDSSCVLLFSGCDAGSDLDFQHQTSAQAAGQAIMDQIYTPNAFYDLNPEQTTGVIDFSIGAIVIPYGIPVVSGNLDVVQVLNYGGINDSSDTVMNCLSCLNENDDTGNHDRRVYALFNEVGTVPLPGSWLLFLGGLASLTARCRRW